MKHTLITDYGFIYLKNPTRVWVRALHTEDGYGLFYADDDYKWNRIYWSEGSAILLDLRDKIIEAIANGEERIDIR